MAKGSLRRFDVQATLSVWLSAAAGLACAVPMFLFARNWNSDMKLVIYKDGGIFKQVFMLSCVVTILLSLFGLALGYNSAGQRRNDKPRRSWMGFFVGTGVLALAIILLFAFMTLEQSRATG